MAEIIDKIIEKFSSIGVKDEKLSSEKIMEMEGNYGAHK